MRVVVLSKALVVGAYQRKLEELAKFPQIELIAIVPPRWHDRRGDVTLERAHTVGYELIVAPLAFNGQYHFHFYPTLGPLLRRLHPDILHVDEEPYNLATWHALRIAQAVGARSLFFTWQNLQRRYPWPFRFFEVANYRRAAYAVAGNQDAVRVLRAKGYRGPAEVIPQFGVDPESFAPAEPINPRAANLANQRLFVIGYVGGLVPEKGVDLLMRACTDLSIGRWSLAILGDGPERAHLEALAGELNIAAQVHFLGRLPSTEVPQFYRTLDVLALPSLSRPNWMEQFGRVLIEAMACGVPVIGSSSGEIPHVIGDAGVIFPEGNVAALHDAIMALATDPTRHADLAQRGRARVLGHFTQARVAAATYRVYRRIFNMPGTAG